MPKVKIKITKFLFFYIKGEVEIKAKTVGEIIELKKNLDFKVS